MKKDRSTASLAERFGSGMARMLPMYAFILFANQASFYGDGRNASPDLLKDGLWLLLSGAGLLLLFGNVGWLNYPRAARRLANDESTRANRNDAIRIAFIASMMACLIIFAVSHFLPLSAREAVHLVMSAGLITALLRLGYLERRARRDA